MADKKTLYILNQLEKYKGLVNPVDNPFKKIKHANSLMKAYHITKIVMVTLIFKSTIFRLTKDERGFETFIELTMIIIGVIILRLVKPLLI